MAALPAGWNFVETYNPTYLPLCEESGLYCQISIFQNLPSLNVRYFEKDGERLVPQKHGAMLWIDEFLRLKDAASEVNEMLRRQYPHVIRYRLSDKAVEPALMLSLGGEIDVLTIARMLPTHDESCRILCPGIELKRKEWDRLCGLFHEIEVAMNRTKRMTVDTSKMPKRGGSADVMPKRKPPAEL